MLLGVYNYTVILTYFGMLVAYTGITLALHGDLNSALLCLMLAGVCDMFDGKITVSDDISQMPAVESSAFCSSVNGSFPAGKAVWDSDRLAQ